eukprot:GFYU01011427.1.p1 GENE.GFYU01011427.1~~GFYU01011427.1.p1  ORF type:complete len:941 (-),score=149.76 GFYU01011427.1:681-3503(-)
MLRYATKNSRQVSKVVGGVAAGYGRGGGSLRRVTVRHIHSQPRQSSVAKGPTTKTNVGSSQVRWMSNAGALKQQKSIEFLKEISDPLVVPVATKTVVGATPKPKPPAKTQSIVVDGNSLVLRCVKTRLAALEQSGGASLVANQTADDLIGCFFQQVVLLMEHHNPKYAMFALHRDLFKQMSHAKLEKKYKKEVSKALEQLLKKVPLIRDTMKQADLMFVPMQGRSRDALASYAREFQLTTDKVVLVSADEEYLQCLKPNRSLYDPLKRVMLEAKDVVESYGVEPVQVPEFLALTAGQRGRGPGLTSEKASALLREHRDVPTLLSSIGDLYGEEEDDIEKVRSYAATIERSIKRASIKGDTAIPTHALDSCSTARANVDVLREYVRSVNVQDMWQNLNGSWPMQDSPNIHYLMSTNGSTVSTTRGSNGAHGMNGANGTSSANGTNGVNRGMNGSWGETASPEVQIAKEDNVWNAVTAPPPPTDGGVGVPVTRVSTPQEAERIMKELRGLKTMERNGVQSVRRHACDTEVCEIDIKKSPYGQGRVTCASIYPGPDVDVGAVWIDALEDPDTLQVMKPYWEDPSVLKVWHNYSFDRAVLHNHGIDVQGLGADTMHMARLHDAARKMEGGYGLEALSKLYLGEEGGVKIPMKDRFGRVNIKADGTAGKRVVLPPIEELQQGLDTRDEFIEYSVQDVVLTWNLFEHLRQKLIEAVWRVEDLSAHGITSEHPTMWQFYQKYYVPFAELLTDMERRGVLVDTEHLQVQQEVAKKDLDGKLSMFKEWAAQHSPDAVFMNPGSSKQCAHLFHGKKGGTGDLSIRVCGLHVCNLWRDLCIDVCVRVFVDCMCVLCGEIYASISWVVCIACVHVSGCLNLTRGDVSLSWWISVPPINRGASIPRTKRRRVHRGGQVQPSQVAAHGPDRSRHSSRATHQANPRSIRDHAFAL